MLVLATFFYCAASAVLPVLPAELWVAGLVPRGLSGPALAAHALAAAAGQMLGKALLFLAARGALEVRWLQARVRSKAAHPPGGAGRGRWSRWYARAQTSRRGQAALCGASAFAGVPPFLVVAVALGALRMPLPLFLLVGGAGRLGRFAVIVAAPTLAADWLLE